MTSAQMDSEVVGPDAADALACDQRRPAGRPRSATVNSKVLEATLELLGEVGISGLTIEGVATRSGVARTSIYRRWPSKTPLIVDALATLYAPIPELPGQSLRGDLVVLARSATWPFADAAHSAVLPRMLVEGRSFPDVAARFAERVVGPRRGLLVERLERARDEGEISPHVDVELLTDLITGPVLWRSMTDHVRGPVPDDFADRIVDAVLTGAVTIS